LSSNFESSKSLAAIGALLLFLSFVPVIGIVGIVLLLVGMKGLSEYYHDESIYMYSLRGLIFGIIGVIAVSAFSFLTFFGGIFSAVELGPAAIIGGIFGVLIVLVVAFTFYLLMAINFRRAYSILAQRSGESNFQTAGTLLFFGAILTIFAVGLILVWIAWIIAAIAFFSMKLTPTQPYTYSLPTSQPLPTVQTTGYCPKCGAPIDLNSTFCSQCGGQLPPA